MVPPLTCMILTTNAASGTLRAKTVTQSYEAAAGTTPVVVTMPRVGLMPTQPFSPAGTLPVHRNPASETEPSDSGASF